MATASLRRVSWEKLIYEENPPIWQKLCFFAPVRHLDAVGMNSSVGRTSSRPLLREILTANQMLRVNQRNRTRSSLDKKVMSKPDISMFRHDLKQNICVEMLQQGYHRSFSELWLLLSSDRDRRAHAEPGLSVFSQTPLEQQRDKLEKIRLHLSEAEDAERKGSWAEACEQRLSLAHFFSAPEDLWISLHFYQSCADKGRGRGLRAAMEAQACMAEVYLQQGALEDARQQAELCLQQTEDDGWLDSSLRHRTCGTLWKIYSRLASDQLVHGNHDQALILIQRGHLMAKEAEDKKMEGDAAYQLGLALQRAQDHKASKQFLTTCMQIRGTLQDARGLVKVYMVMAQSLQSEGNVDESIQYLEKAAEVSQSNDLPHKLANICISLGNIYYTKNQYERACEYFQQGFDVACKMEDLTVAQEIQVLLASARSQTQIRNHIVDVDSDKVDAVI